MSPKSVKNSIQLQKQNQEKYKLIIKDFVYKIKQQGYGCNVPGYGASYYNNFDKTFDPFGLVLGFQKINNHYGIISDESQKPIVTSMSRKYGIIVHTEKSYYEFVKFLQDCQDIHDFAFDEYYEVQGSRMEQYLSSMKSLLNSINLS